MDEILADQANEKRPRNWFSVAERRNRLSSQQVNSASYRTTRLEAFALLENEFLVRYIPLGESQMPKVESHIFSNLRRKKAQWPWGFIAVVAVLWLLAFAVIFKLSGYECLYNC
jgi:hypothetical protein